MRRPVLILSAMLLLALPHAAAAGTPALDVPGAARAGQRLEIRWDGLAGSVREVELELSLDGGRWVRVSPELEAGDGHYHWRVPAVSSAHARLRLRAGGDGFEGQIAASNEFRIESREPAGGERSNELDWWRVGEHTAGPGWGLGPPAATLSGECTPSFAEPDSRAHGSAHAPSRVCIRLDERGANGAPRSASADLATILRYPMRL